MRFLTCLLLAGIVLAPARVAVSDVPEPATAGLGQAILAIELKAQLKAYEIIVTKLHRANIQAAMLGIRPSASEEQLKQARLKVALLENLKETALLNLSELEKRQTGVSRDENARAGHSKLR